MLGAIIGDIVGSRFEWNNHKDKENDLCNRIQLKFSGMPRFQKPC